MWQQIFPGLRIQLFMTLIFGLVYPLAITGISQIAFPDQANGSLIQQGGRTIGSKWIGQDFTRPEYFHPRPSAVNYDASASGASNYGPMNPKLAERVKGSVAQFRRENPDYRGPVPGDAVTTSASGLDPHITPAYAEAQVARVARSRGIAAADLLHLVEQHTETRTWGVLGEPRVNVLQLNLALDQRFPRK